MVRIVIAGLVLSSFAATADAHGKKSHGKQKTFVTANLDMVENGFGRTGDPKRISRTISVKMSDKLTFESAVIRVKAGETIRFLVENIGDAPHEFVIGKTKDLIKHAALMQSFPAMEHSEPFMAHAGAGQTAEVVWTFSKPGTVDFGCLLPGYYEPGMKGLIYVDGGNILPANHSTQKHKPDNPHNANGDAIGLSR